MPVQTVELPLRLFQLEQYAFAASTDDRLQLLSHHVDVNSDEWHYMQLLAWQTADMQHFQQRNNDNTKQAAPNTTTPHCTSKPYNALLTAYKDRYPHSSQLRMIQLRHDLLTFLASPSETVQQVIKKICRDYANIEFNHAPLTAEDGHTTAADDDKHDFPTRLDPALVQLDKLIAEPSKGGREGLGGFSSSPLTADAIARHFYSTVVVKKPKDDDNSLRNSVAYFLGNLNHPAVPHLLDLLVYDMSANSISFGGRNVHVMLPLSELKQLSKRWPDIEQQQQYVMMRLERMLPDGGLDGLTVEQKMACYDEQATYCHTLSEAHVDIKANTYYHALAFKLQQGIYDEQLFSKHYLAP